MHAVWMIAGSFFFASMSVCVKFASPHFSTLENVFYRGVIGLVFMAILARSRKISLRTTVPMMHIWRNVMGVTAMAASFYALAHLPLATAMTLNYMSGVWVATFLIAGTFVMGRLTEIRRQGPLVLTVLTAFAGVIMLLRPTLDQDQLFAGLVGMLSGLLGAMAYIQVAALGRVGESETRTVFYFSLGGAVAGAAGMLIQGASNLARVEALWLLPMGILAALGQLCMTRAYTRGPAIVVANLQYTSIVFAALYGLILFGDSIPLMGWAGMALVISSAMAATVLRTRAVPNLPAEEH
ncbi:DMT family transporter [Ottowia thiooxydans]|uniref:DMT family transporter n=1 Tax=Ottowia thiooxydans TaxID=219182 RepID=UPI0004183048|nr:DMT family transporter [Ottowia thiooxydans]